MIGFLLGLLFGLALGVSVGALGWAILTGAAAWEDITAQLSEDDA